MYIFPIRKHCILRTTVNYCKYLMMKHPLAAHNKINTNTHATNKRDTLISTEESVCPELL